MNPSTRCARVIIDELARAGVTDAVLAPGSRSAPLAFALHHADVAGRLRLHVRIDDRSAGFLALGLAKHSGLPVPVVTTSGTAVANLHPAVLEASHSGIPLFVLSADRPVELLGTGANQTTDQVKLFGDAVRWFGQLTGDSEPHVARGVVGRAMAAAVGARTRDPGPVHLNVSLREPLTPDGSEPGGWSADLARADGGSWTSVERVRGGDPAQATVLPIGPRTVVVAGDDAGPPARLLAESANWPLFAEPSSGSRTGLNPVLTYRLLLDDHDLADDIERVVVTGHPTLSRAVTRLLSREDLEIVVVAPRGRWPDVGNQAGHVLVAARVEEADVPDDTTWLDRWRAADRRVRSALDSWVAQQPALSPLAVARVVGESLPPRGLLVVGSSNPVRDLDLMMPAHDAGQRRKTIANRGLAGIDGTVSTAIGAALARESSVALAYLGDLTFLHDVNGLLIGPDEPCPDLTFVVANDEGGSIFATLEQGAPEFSAAFERVFGTPHHVDLAGLCAAYGLDYERISDPGRLRTALGEQVRGVRVLEVPLRRDTRRADDEAVRQIARRVAEGA
ncbi:MAG: 2-succinyl-5-enolpyruvyl-6-hydroxy-3-cyclohexene-1-carboxylic-acid synthase [Nocardioidaceae bacterium]